VPNGGNDLTDEQRAKGRETQRRNREERRRELELDLEKRAALDTALDALVAVAGDVEAGAERVSAAKEIIHQLVGRPVAERVVSGDQERPVQIVVRSAFRDSDGGSGEQG
jgi:hypothetical protein